MSWNACISRSCHPSVFYRLVLVSLAVSISLYIPRHLGHPPILLHIFKRVDEFVCVWGHTDSAYSKWWQTKAAYRRLKIIPSKYVKLRRIRPTIAFATRILAEMCSSNLSSESLVTPRSFCSKTCSNSLSQML